MQSEFQKELVTGEAWYEPGQDIPNVGKKLFALRNQCTECNVCEVACSLIHSPTNEINPQLARIRIDHSHGQTIEDSIRMALGFVAEICHHCGNPPPCAEVCPTDAFYYDPETQGCRYRSGQMYSMYGMRSRLPVRRRVRPHLAASY